jgi:hypothetical protein
MTKSQDMTGHPTSIRAAALTAAPLVAATVAAAAAALSSQVSIKGPPPADQRYNVDPTRAPQMFSSRILTSGGGRDATQRAINGTMDGHATIESEDAHRSIATVTEGRGALCCPNLGLPPLFERTPRRRRTLREKRWGEGLAWHESWGVAIYVLYRDDIDDKLQKRTGCVCGRGVGWRDLNGARQQAQAGRSTGRPRVGRLSRLWSAGGWLFFGYRGLGKMLWPGFISDVPPFAI